MTVIVLLGRWSYRCLDPHSWPSACAKASARLVLIENVTGGAGTVGVGRVARAPGDGYTLSFGHWSTHVINGAAYPLTFDLLTDLEPVALLTSYPMLLVSEERVPAKDLKEFLTTWVESQSGQGSGRSSIGRR